MTKNRLPEFDIAKGIGIICVILGHLGIKEVDRVVFVFHMPLFFLIGGYFLSKTNGYKFFVQKKFKQLIIPYIIACLFICILSIPMSVFFDQDIGTNLYKWICGSIYGSGTRSAGIISGVPIFIGAIWFLEALFFGFILTRYVIDQCPENIAPFAILIISYVGYATSNSWLPFNIQAGCTAAGFIYLGFVFRRYCLLDRHLPPVVLLFLVMIVAWCIKYFKGFGLVRNHFGNGWMDVIGALAATYLIILFCKYIVTKVGCISKVLQWFGRNSLIILVCHIIELDLVPRVKVLNYFQGLGLTFGEAVCVLVLCKIFWATSGVLFINHSSGLKKIFNGNW